MKPASFCWRAKGNYTVLISYLKKFLWLPTDDPVSKKMQNTNTDIKAIKIFFSKAITLLHLFVILTFFKKISVLPVLSRKIYTFYTKS